MDILDKYIQTSTQDPLDKYLEPQPTTIKPPSEVDLMMLAGNRPGLPTPTPTRGILTEPLEKFWAGQQVRPQVPLAYDITHPLSSAARQEDVYQQALLEAKQRNPYANLGGGIAGIGLNTLGNIFEPITAPYRGLLSSVGAEVKARRQGAGFLKQGKVGAKAFYPAFSGEVPYGGQELIADLIPVSEDEGIGSAISRYIAGTAVDLAPYIAMGVARAIEKRGAIGKYLKNMDVWKREAKVVAVKEDAPVIDKIATEGKALISDLYDANKSAETPIKQIKVTKRGKAALDNIKRLKTELKTKAPLSGETIAQPPQIAGEIKAPPITPSTPLPIIPSPQLPKPQAVVSPPIKATESPIAQLKPETENIQGGETTACGLGN